jgi:hypothetical protein
MSTKENFKKSGKVIGRDRAPMLSYKVDGMSYTPRMERQPDGTWKPCKGFLEFMGALENNGESRKRG